LNANTQILQPALILSQKSKPRTDSPKVWRNPLITLTGGTIGKTFLVVNVPVVSIFASYLIRVQPVRSLHDRYIKLFCESDVYWIQLTAGSRGAGQPNVRSSPTPRRTAPQPALGQAVKGCGVAALIGKCVDGARSTHDLSSRVGNDAASEMLLWDRQIAPVRRTALS